MTLTREKILARRAIKTETVPAPELDEGATLTVRRLSAAGFMALSEKTKADPELAYAHWLVACVVDEHGKPLFNDDDVPAIVEFDITLVERLNDAAQRLNISKKAPDGPNQQSQSDASPSA